MSTSVWNEFIYLEFVFVMYNVLVIICTIIRMLHVHLWCLLTCPAWCFFLSGIHFHWTRGKTEVSETTAEAATEGMHD